MRFGIVIDWDTPMWFVGDFGRAQSFSADERAAHYWESQAEATAELRRLKATNPGAMRFAEVRPAP